MANFEFVWEQFRKKKLLSQTNYMENFNILYFLQKQNKLYY